MYFQVKGIQFSSNEGQLLYSKGETNSKIEKYIDSFKQYFPQEQLGPILLLPDKK